LRLGANAEDDTLHRSDERVFRSKIGEQCDNRIFQKATS